MKIAFYAPFKPLGHKNPSGDLIIAKSLVQFLEDKGHSIEIQSRLRARWIYLKPWLWIFLAAEFLRILVRLLKYPPDLWLTYHSYYKAPDMIGPWICRILGIKYVIYQGIYSTKRRRSLKTILGFYLNRSALLQADHIFTNKAPDLKNLKRLVPEEKITYIRPGIDTELFSKSKESLKPVDHQGDGQRRPVILTAAMFRDDVKTKGLIWLIQCMGRMKNKDFDLVIAGTGKMKDDIIKAAQTYLPGNVSFTGKIERQKMARFYSSGDLFVFPGIRESLGMVFLEAQACGLPVVAFDNAGVPEVVKDGETGFLVPVYDCKRFSDSVSTLLADSKLRQSMGLTASKYVRRNHDIKINYIRFEKALNQMVG